MKIIYVGMNGGLMEKVYMSQVLFDFEKVNNVKVVIVFGMLLDVFVKLFVNWNKLQIYVVFFDDGVMVCVVSFGVCQKFDDLLVLKELYLFVWMKDDVGVGVQFGMIGIVYNKKLFVEKGWVLLMLWMDFVDLKYKGKVVFQLVLSSMFGLYGFFVINWLFGGNEQNVEFGFGKWVSMVGLNVVEYILNLVKIFEMVQMGEVGLFLFMLIGVGDLQDKGIFVVYVNLKEGLVLLFVDLCVVVNNFDL